MQQDNLLELYPDSDHSRPPRFYNVRTTRTTPEPVYYDQQAQDADQQSAPDSFYFEAAGQEPGPVESGNRFFKGCLNATLLSVIFWSVLGLAILAFWPVG